MKFRENMSSLSEIVGEYSHGRISIEEYRRQRTLLLNMIDQELNGVVIIEQENISEKVDDESLLTKTLSFLKLDKLKETN